MCVCVCVLIQVVSCLPSCPCLQVMSPLITSAVKFQRRVQEFLGKDEPLRLVAPDIQTFGSSAYCCVAERPRPYQ